MLGAAELRSLRVQILRLATEHGATNVRVFGSVARGEARYGSDLDLLVDTEPGRSLLDLGGLLVDLEELLQRRVHLVTRGGLHPLIREQVLEEAVPL